MSIVPSPGQMGPGTGSISIGLSVSDPITTLSWKDYILGLWLGGRGPITENPFLELPTFRDALEEDLRSQRPTLDFSHVINPSYRRPSFDLFSSSGGGGPGELPNLHRPLPSIEETGELLSNPPIVGEVPSSPSTYSLKSTRTRKKKRKACPPGYRWSRRAKRCLHRQDSYEDYRARQSSSW
jgi:hypothetical protein